MHMCSDNDLIHQRLFSDLSSKFISWEKMSKRKRLSQRIWLCRLIPKGVLGNQLSFCKQPVMASVNHSLEMWQSHLQHTAPENQKTPVWGEVPFVYVVQLWAVCFCPDSRWLVLLAAMAAGLPPVKLPTVGGLHNLFLIFVSSAALPRRYTLC